MSSKSFFFCCDGVILRPCGTAVPNWPFVHPSDNTWVNTEQRYIDNNRGKRKTWKKTCLSATLSTTNSTWTILGAIPGVHDEKPVTNGPHNGTAESGIKTWSGVYDSGNESTWSSHIAIETVVIYSVVLVVFVVVWFYWEFGFLFWWHPSTYWWPS
jgi:hypothetical protein